MPRPLTEIVEAIEAFMEHGLGPFAAMCAALEDDEWDRVVAILRVVAKKKGSPNDTRIL